MGGEHRYGEEGLLTGMHMYRVPVTNVEMALEFYRDVLLLKVIEEGEDRVELSLGNSSLLIYVPLKHEGRQPGGPTGLVLSTDSIYDFHHRMVDEGVEFVIKPQMTELGLAASFVDDDGNEFTVVDRPSRRP